MLMVFSTAGICSKLAGRYDFLSLGFCFFYGLLLMILALYAIAWQQIIKYLPLTAAYANRAVGVVWGAVWGALVFQEEIKPNQIAGIALVVIGVVFYAFSDKQDGDFEKENISSEKEISNCEEGDRQI